MERKERWKYYTSSFVRVEPTEGVPRDRMRKTVLARNQRQTNGDADSDTDSSAAVVKKPWSFDEGLILQICVNTYNITYKKDTTDFHIFNVPKAIDPDHASTATAKRKQRFQDKFVLNSPWMKNMSHGEVEKVKEDFRKWVEDGVLPTSNAVTVVGEEAL